MTDAAPLLAFYGDDFTGSTDALEVLERGGLRTMLFLAPPTPATLAGFPGLQAVGVAGVTRSMTPEAMEATLRPAFRDLRELGASHVHYKVCSTFDSSADIGSIGRAVDVGAEIFPAKFVPILAGSPGLGRYCAFGNLFARVGIGSNGAIHRLDRHPVMSRHPITPAHDSDLRGHLASQTAKSVGLFDLLKLELEETEARAVLAAIVADGAKIVLFDVLYESQLARIGALIDGYASRNQPLFSVGSSGIESALTAHWAAAGRIPGQPRHWTHPGPAGPLLILSGSCSPVTAGQIEWALAHGFGEVPIDTAALARGSSPDEIETQAAAAAVARLKAGQGVVVHSARGPADPRLAATDAGFAGRGIGQAGARVRTAELFGSALGRIARHVLERITVRRLLIAGGDTSGFAARALDARAIELIASPAPGVSLCRIHAPGSPADGLQVNFKGGQLGSESYFGLVAGHAFERVENRPWPAGPRK